MREPSEIYPEVPKEIPKEKPKEGGDEHRLTKVDKVLKDLESEARHYEGVRKKYSRSFGIAHNIGVGAGAIGIVLTSTALGTFLTGLGIPFAVPVGALGGIFGIVPAVSAAVSKKLSVKVSKHEQITSIAKAKANTVKDLVSKALRDDKITKQEFDLILTESDKFEKLKSEVRQKQLKEQIKPAKKNVSKSRDSLIMHVKEELLMDFAKTQQ